MQHLSKPLAELRENLVGHYNEEELRTLCFDVGIDYDDLPGRSRNDKARELLAHLDRVGRVADLIQRCEKERPNVPWREIAEVAVAAPPFKGLEFFDVGDAALFFGREALTARLIGRLRDARGAPPREAGWRFLAVVGASGSGKSSLVRAGLAAALQSREPLADGTLPPDGSADWRLHILTPTAQPLKALAASLTRESESVTAMATLMDDLARDPRSLDLYAARLLAWAGTRRLLLVVDQFEELFTLCRSESERKAFVDNLVSASADEISGQTLVVIALRADFYAQCAPYDGLRQLLPKRQEYIGAMTADELRRAIEEPARMHGFAFEPGLVDTLLLDVGQEPGALPLLSHALLETWKRREGRILTLKGYADTGRLRGAIARTADAVYDQLSPEEQVVARSIFLRLTALGEGTQDTRRRVLLQELIPRQPQQEALIRSVVSQLADARLVTVDEKSAEVAHEALIREWPKLRSWLDEDRASLQIHHRLTERAQEWARLGRDVGSLLQGAHLREIEGWAVTHREQMDSLERDFLEASRSNENLHRVQERRRIVLRGTVAFLLSAVCIALLALAWMYYWGRGAFWSTGTWSRLGALDKRITAIATDWQYSGTVYVGTEDGFLLRNSNKGQDWSELLAQDRGWVGLITLSADRMLYMVTSKSAVFRSSDSGDHWIDLGPVSDAGGVTDLVADPVNPQILYVCDSESPHVYRSTNTGETWDTVDVGSGNQRITALVAGVLSDTDLCTIRGSHDGYLWRSTDHGMHWTGDLLKKPLGFFVWDIALDGTDPNLLYAATADGLYRIRSGDSSDESRRLTNLLGLQVVVEPVSPGTVFMRGIGDEVWLLQDQGDEPELVSIAGQGSFLPYSLLEQPLALFDHRTFYLYASTDQGVFGWRPSRWIAKKLDQRISSQLSE